MSLRKSIGLVLSIVSLLVGCVGLASASTLSWDRNQTDLDVAKYTVYRCTTAGCVVMATAANAVGTVPQPAAGVVPSFPVTILGLNGAFGITASDLSGNESDMSVPLPFDSTRPTAPQGPRLVP